MVQTPSIVEENVSFHLQSLPQFQAGVSSTTANCGSLSIVRVYISAAIQVAENGSNSSTEKFKDPTTLQ